MAHIKESTHWYDKEGNPAYTVTGKNGKERATTLRDARVEGYVPSVTTILGEANKPGLIAWKENQVLMAALTLPRVQGEAEREYIDRIKADAKEQAEKARQRGTDIHAYIQRGFEFKNYESEEERDFFLSAKNCMNTEEIGDENWICEKSFTKDGFGGKCDLHTHEYIIDIKTKDASLEKIQTYDEHAMQLAAYRHGLGYPSAKCGILFVSTLDKTAKLVWIEEDKIIKGFKMFQALKDYFYAKTGLKEAI